MRSRLPVAVVISVVCAIGAPAASSVADEIPVGSDPSSAVRVVSAGLETVSTAGLRLPGVVDPPVSDAAELPAVNLAGGIRLAEGPAVRPDARVVVGLTAPIDASASDVQVVGASWLATSTTDVAVDIRLRLADGWGEWQAIAVESATDGGEGASRSGTEPYVVTGAQEVQARLLVTSGAAPDGARLDVYESDVTATDARTSVSGVVAGRGTGLAFAANSVVDTGTVASSVAATRTLSAPRPTIHLRSEWGAVAPGEMDIGKVNGATVHHTAGSNSYASSAVPAILRGIQRFHMQTRGWSDIGYNFLVDRYGRVWEGRGGGVENTTKGVHASSFNGITTGVSVIGNFQTGSVSSGVLNALTSLLAWKLALHGVRADATMMVNGVPTPVIVGHRDVPEAQTACPGIALYRLLPRLRSLVLARQRLSRTSLDHDLTGDGVPDLLEVGATEARVLTGRLGVLGVAQQIGHGWGQLDMIAGSPAFAGGSTTDIVARATSTGRLRVYRGNGSGGFSGMREFGSGWNAMSAVVAPGDFDGDGVPDLIAVVRATGQLRLYRGNGTGSFLPFRSIGSGWSSMEWVAGAGDFNGDGATDLLAKVRATGELRLYPGSGHGTFESRVSLGASWATSSSGTGIGDVDGDGQPDLVLLDGTAGVATLLLGTGDGRIDGSRTVLSGLVGTRDATCGADWFGKGRTTLVSVDSATGYLRAREVQKTLAFQAEGGPTIDTSDATAVAVVGDVTGSGASSVVTRMSDGRLMLHEFSADGTLAAPRQIGVSWNSMTDIAAGGDLDYDGMPDLLAVGSNGLLYLYPFNPGGTGRLMARSVIATGFAGLEVFGVGGWKAGTGSDVVSIRPSTGEMKLYQGYGRLLLSSGVTIAKSWSSMSDVIPLPGRESEFGAVLLTRVASNGASWVYPASGKGGFAARYRVVIDANGSLR